MSGKDTGASGDPSLERNRENVRWLKGHGGVREGFFFSFLNLDRRRPHISMLLGDKSGARENVGVQGEWGRWRRQLLGQWGPKGQDCVWAQGRQGNPAGGPGSGREPSCGDTRGYSTAGARRAGGGAEWLAEERSGNLHAVVGAEVLEPGGVTEVSAPGWRWPQWPRWLGDKEGRGGGRAHLGSGQSGPEISR